MEQFNYIILDRYETTNAERQEYLNSGNYIIVHSDTRELILKRKETNKK